jgi:hypothetical protein
MKKYALTVLPALLLFFSCSKELPGQQPSVVLPDNAKSFILEFFPSDSVQHVAAKKSPTAYGTFYEARLTSGTEVDFGKEGNWTEATAEKPNQIPTSFFPDAIKSYLEANYIGVGVQSIDKEATGYEVELINDIDLFFDTQGVFLRKDQ